MDSKEKIFIIHATVDANHMTLGVAVGRADIKMPQGIPGTIEYRCLKIPMASIPEDQKQLLFALHTAIAEQALATPSKIIIASPGDFKANDGATNVH